MPLPIRYVTLPGKSLVVTLVRQSDFYEWRQAVTAGWEEASTSTFADRKIAMTEGTGANVGSYSVTVSGLGDAAWVTVRIHDDADAADKSIGLGEVYVRGGNEIRFIDSQAEIENAIGISQLEIEEAIDALEAHGDSEWVSGTTLVTPLAVTVSAGEVSSNTLVAYQYAAFSFLFAFNDDEGQPLDIDGHSVKFTVYENDAAQTVLFALEFTGVDNRVSVVSDAGTDLLTEQAGLFGFVLRDEEDDTVLAVGSFEIVSVPEPA